MLAVASRQADEQGFAQWLRQRVRLPEYERPPHGDPDFSAIFGPDDPLTPRMAARLWVAALYYAEPSMTARHTTR